MLSQSVFVCILQEVTQGLNVVIDIGNPHDLGTLFLASPDPDLHEDGGGPQGQAPDAEADGRDGLLVTDQGPVNHPHLAGLREKSPQKVVVVRSNDGLHSRGERLAVTFNQIPAESTGWNFVLLEAKFI